MGFGASEVGEQLSGKILFRFAAFCLNDVKGEDRFFVEPEGIAGVCDGLVGIFDGHNGSAASEYCKQHCQELLERKFGLGRGQGSAAELARDADGVWPLGIDKILTSVFQELDREVKSRTSAGATATLFLFTKDASQQVHIKTIWVGDSAAIYIDHKGKYSELTAPHRLSSPMELARVADYYRGVDAQATSSDLPTAMLGELLPIHSTRKLHAIPICAQSAKIRQIPPLGPPQPWHGGQLPGSTTPNEKPLEVEKENRHSDPNRIMPLAIASLMDSPDRDRPLPRRSNDGPYGIGSKEFEDSAHSSDGSPPTLAVSQGKHDWQPPHVPIVGEEVTSKPTTQAPELKASGKGPFPDRPERSIHARRQSFLGLFVNEQGFPVTEIPRLFNRDGTSMNVLRTIGDRRAARAVICMPEVTTMTVDLPARFVIATDGIWDTLPPKQTCKAARSSDVVKAGVKLFKQLEKSRQFYGHSKDDTTCVLVDMVDTSAKPGKGKCVIA